jgi:hypothetical protein
MQYWQPQLAYLWWNDVARMNNRDLELWCEPDCGTQPLPGYYSNVFFLQAAGGAQGLIYFMYGTQGRACWDTLGKIGTTIVAPYYPFLGKLRPSRTSVGFLVPYTQYAYSQYYPTGGVYPYANLLGAHVDAQPICEEEVLSGDAARYKTIVLWRVQYLRQSVVTALENYIAQGGTVVCDATTVVPLKGAIKSPVDLAMGAGKSEPDPNDPRLGGPGIGDYLKPEVVAAVRQGLASSTQPWFDCADPTIIGRRHEYRGVTYLWLVNVDSHADYNYLRPRLGAPNPSPKQAAQEAIAYAAQRGDGRHFLTSATIPAGAWAAYDVLQGKRIPLTKIGNRLSFQADMEHMGGELIALYPEPLARVAIAAQPVARGQRVPLTIRVLGPSGKPIPGTQPLSVQVLTPKGEWAEITGPHATDDGVWTATLNPALNDMPGAWRIRVKELSSGVTSEAVVTVK